MADSEGFTEGEQRENTAQTAQKSLENETQSEVNSLRHYAQAKLTSSGSTVKRYGVVDFDNMENEVLDEFDPLKECDDNSSSQTTAQTKYLDVLKDDKSVSRYSAPGLLYGSQSEEHMPNELGATGFSHFGSEDDILVGTSRDQRDFEHNGFDVDLERATRKGQSIILVMLRSLFSVDSMHLFWLKFSAS